MHTFSFAYIEIIRKSPVIENENMRKSPFVEGQIMRKSPFINGLIMHKSPFGRIVAIFNSYFFVGFSFHPVPQAVR